jgi:hypothetical protein
MTDLVQRTDGAAAGPSNPTVVRTGTSADALRQAVSDHLVYSIARPPAVLTPEHPRTDASRIGCMQRSAWSRQAITNSVCS